MGPADAAATVWFRTPQALQRLLTAPGELGLGRAYVAGEIDVEGDLQPLLDLGDRREGFRLGASDVVSITSALARIGALRPRRLPPPPEEAHLRGRRHTRQRDA